MSIPNYIGKIVEIANSNDEDLNNFIEDFNKKFNPDSNSVYVKITNQDDYNFWGDIVNSNSQLDYHFEIDDIIQVY